MALVRLQTSCSVWTKTPSLLLIATNANLNGVPKRCATRSSVESEKKYPEQSWQRRGSWT